MTAHLSLIMKLIGVISMAEEKETKKDELLVLRLIGEGINRIKEIQERLEWSRERVEKTVELLRKNEYVQNAEKASDRVLQITARGQKELPKLMGEVIQESRKFINSVSKTFEKRFSKIFPKIDIEVKIDEGEEESGETYTCKKCGQNFESERALELHQGSEH